jgi:hypothetical protein
MFRLLLAGWKNRHHFSWIVCRSVFWQTRVIVRLNLNERGGRMGIKGAVKELVFLINWPCFSHDLLFIRKYECLIRFYLSFWKTFEFLLSTINPSKKNAQAFRRRSCLFHNSFAFIPKNIDLQYSKSLIDIFLHGLKWPKYQLYTILVRSRAFTGKRER